jgi:hypothetical protein
LTDLVFNFLKLDCELKVTEWCQNYEEHNKAGAKGKHWKTADIFELVDDRQHLALMLSALITHHEETKLNHLIVFNFIRIEVVRCSLNIKLIGAHEVDIFELALAGPECWVHNFDLMKTEEHVFNRELLMLFYRVNLNDVENLLFHLSQCWKIVFLVTIVGKFWNDWIVLPNAALETRVLKYKVIQMVAQPFINLLGLVTPVAVVGRISTIG